MSTPFVYQSVVVHYDADVEPITSDTIFLTDIASSLVRPTDLLLEVGVGMGLVTLSLAKNVGCMVRGLDINPNAIACSKANARLNQLENLTQFECVDYRDYFSKKPLCSIDWIVCNPPYSHSWTTFRDASRALARDISTFDLPLFMQKSIPFCKNMLLLIPDQIYPSLMIKTYAEGIDFEIKKVFERNSRLILWIQNRTLLS